MDHVVVKSKFNFWNGYFVTLVAFLLPFVWLFLCYKLIADFSWSAVIGVVVFGFAAFAFLRYIVRKVCIVTIFNTGVEVRFINRKRFIHWNEVAAIRLTGKEFVSFGIAGYNYESSSITTTQEEEYLILHSNYRNYDAIVRVLENANEMRLKYPNSTMLVLKDPGAIEEIRDFHYIRSEYTKYSGYLLFSFRGSVFYSVSIFMIFMGSGLLLDNNPFGYFLFLIVAFFQFITGTIANYFLVSDDYLIVKNVSCFWRKKVYRIDQIREVIIEEQQNSPIALRITTKDFRTRDYGAEGLRNKTWRALVEKFKGKVETIRVEVLID